MMKPALTALAIAMGTLSLRAPTAGAAEPATPLARPTPQQAEWHDMEIGMFIHFAPNTWQDQEYDNLSTPLSRINPDKLDTDQWASVAEAMGARYIVFVAKHVGGFCMWQTQTTDYGIRSTPWRGGKGDVLKDLWESCRKRGLRLGVYLSPADSKHKAGVGGKCGTPQEQERYDKIYRQQLTEVLSNYGEMFEVWFDGSNVVDVGDILRKHAPKAMVFQGPHATIRWVGNEEGVAPYPAWNSVSQADAKSGVATAANGRPDGAAWLPNECDARIRANWFWNTRNARTLKSVQQLMDMYYRSVGHGAVLLLNHTPDPTGLIPEADARRAAEFGAEIRRRFGTPLGETQGQALGAPYGGETVELDLGKPTVIDHAVTMEDIAQGERVREYVIEGWAGQKWQPLSRGSAIGHKKIDRFAPVEVSKVRLRCVKSADVPQIRRLAVYAVRGQVKPSGTPLREPIGHWTFDQVKDAVAADAAAKPAHGSVRGAAAAEGVLGKALRFNGKDACVKVGNVGYLGGDFTLACWVKPAAAAGKERMILAKDRVSVGDYQFRFYLSGAGRLGFAISDASGHGVWPFEAPDPLPAETWSHVAVTRDQKQYVLYVGGKAAARTEAAWPIEHENDLDLLIGARLGADEGLDRVFDGLIDDVRIYNRPLAASEVAALAGGSAATGGAPAGEGQAIGRWTPQTFPADGAAADFNISPFCKEAAQYEVVFRKTGGQGDLEAILEKSLTLFHGRTETPQFVKPVAGKAFLYKKRSW